MAEQHDFSCYLCGCKNPIVRSGHARDDERLVPLECRECGLVSLSSFAHITDSFYYNSHMHDSTPCDSALEILQSQEDSGRRYIQFHDHFAGKRLLDIGCGTGGFLLKARELATSVAGVEPECRLYPHFQEHGLAVYPDIRGVPTSFEPDIVTMFHVLEHIPDPISILKQIRERFFYEKKKSHKLIIEVPNANDALLTLYQNDAFSKFTYWSCHLFLFTENALQTLLERAGFVAVEITQFQRYPLANHLHWLAYGKPGGHVVWDFFNKKGLAGSYSDSLADLKACDTIIGIFSCG